MGERGINSVLFKNKSDVLHWLWVGWLHNLSSILGHFWGVPPPPSNRMPLLLFIAMRTVYLFSFILRWDLTMQSWTHFPVQAGLQLKLPLPQPPEFIGRDNLEFLCQSWALFWDLSLGGNKHLGTVANQAECFWVLPGGGSGGWGGDPKAPSSLCRDTNSIGLYKESNFRTWKMAQQPETFAPKTWQPEFDPWNLCRGERREPVPGSRPPGCTASSTSPVCHSQTHMHTVENTWQRQF